MCLKKLILITSFALIPLCVFASEFMVAKVVGLDSIDNIIAVKDLNSPDKVKRFELEPGLLQSVHMGQEIVLEIEGKKVINIKVTDPMKHMISDPFFDSWDPFESLGRMRSNMRGMMNNLFPGSGRGKGIFNSAMFYEPDFDIKENKEEYIITFNIEDLNQKTLNVDINKRGITVSGESSSEREEQSQNSFFKSSSFGSFMKTVPVPEDADIGNAKTETLDNKLIITLPKN